MSDETEFTPPVTASNGDPGAVAIMGDETHALTNEGHDASEDGSGRGTPVVAIPISSDALRGEGTSKTPGPDADGRVRLRDPGLGIGGEDDPAYTVNATTPGAVAYPLARRGREHGAELEVGEANVYNALRAGDGGSSRLNQVLTPEATVRRLTPKECERLQGFPDDWTLLDETTKDSKRYAALGDAVTVNVAEWIGRRIVGAA